MNLLKNKKHTETRKETAPLKMKRGQKKLFALYAVMVREKYLSGQYGKNADGML